MKHEKSAVLEIVLAQPEQTLSKAQNLFNKLTKKINKHRQELLAWQEMIPAYAQKYANELDPLFQSYDQCAIEFIKRFDSMHADKALTNSERKKVSHIICGLVQNLLSHSNKDSEDEEREHLKQLYSKHSGINFDEIKSQEGEFMKSMLGDMLGIDLGDDIDPNAPQEEVMSKIGEKLQKKMIEEEQAELARRSKRKKSAKTLEKEARQQEEEKNLSQSLREVYRKLASALHPDREYDPAERERKTALMQRVNIAYEKNNLLQLLELQLEVEQIDQSMINNISENRLQHYNKILTEQCTELQQEIKQTEFSFRMQYNFEPWIKLSPAIALLKLKVQVQEMKISITRIKDDIAGLDDIKKLKSDLKTFRASSFSTNNLEMF